MAQRRRAGGIVTPEAVPLEFDAAGVGSRAVAFALDLAVMGATILVLGLAAALVASGTTVALPDWVAVTLALLVVFAVFWGYPVAFETLWRGRTLGKAAMGLRVVTVEGSPVRFRHAAVRAALGLVDFYLTSGFAAVLIVLVTPRSQRLGDLVAGTLVLRERTGAPAPTAVSFTIPAGAQRYAATIDPSGLTIDDYASVRAFLLRAAELRPEVRRRLAQRLAPPLAERLGHAPPQGVSPELFLACLAARYQQRGATAATAARDADPGGGDGRGAAASGERPGGFVPPS